MKKSIVSLCSLLLFCSPLLNACSKNETSTSYSSTEDSTSSSEEKISLENPFKSVYGLGEVIDFSAIEIKVKKGNEVEYVNGLDNRVTITGGDTSTIGQKTISIAFQGETFTFGYEVKEYHVTLNFNGGQYQEKESLVLPCKKNRVDLSSIKPEKADEEGNVLIFSGWFYDENLTKRVSSLIESEFYTENDVTLYAGFDADYTEQFIYRIDKESQSATILTVNFDNIFMLTMESELHIPSTIENYPVKEIASSVFYDAATDTDYASWMMISEIVFDEDSRLEIIGENAFNQMSSLNQIKFPKTLKKIGKYAFSATGLGPTLELPSSLEEIGEMAFSYISNLEKVTLPENSHLKLIDKEAFSGDFYLTDFSFPDSLEEIREGAFSSCNDMSEIHLPKNLKVIGPYAFKNMRSLKKIEVDEGNNHFVSVDGNLYNKAKTKLLKFCTGSQLTEFTLPSTVRIIGDSAFNSFGNVSALKKVIVSEGLTYIGKEAFYDCSFDLELPSTLSSFSLEAFNGYSGKNITLSKNNTKYTLDQGILYSINHQTLYKCLNSLRATQLVLDDRVKTISQNAFLGCSKIESLRISSSSSLVSIQKDGIPLSSMNELKYIQIDLSNPILMNYKSFGMELSSFNASYHILFGNDTVKDALLSTMNNEEKETFESFIQEKSTIKDTVKEEIAGAIGLTYQENLSGSHATLFEIIRPDGLAVNNINSLLSYLYQTMDYTTEEFAYYTEYEKIIYASLALGLKQEEYGFNYDLTQKYIDRYQNLPSSIKKATEGSYTIILSLLKGINKSDELNSLYSEILSMPVDEDTFDVEKYLQIEKKAEEYNLDSISLPDAVYEKYIFLKISYQISVVTKIPLEEITYSNMNQLNYYLFPCQENNYYTLPTMIAAYCSTDYRKKQIYHYNEFQTYYENFLTVYENEREKLKQEMLDFDITTYDKTRYASFFEEKVMLLETYYATLEDEEPTILDKVLTICINLNIQSLIDTLSMDGSDEISLNEKNFTSCYYYIDLVDYYIGCRQKVNKDNIHQYEKYKELRTKVQNYAKQYATTFRKEIKDFQLTKENLTTEKVDALYQKYVNLDIKNVWNYSYGEFFLSCDIDEIITEIPCEETSTEENIVDEEGEEEFDYLSQYYTILSSMCIKVLFDTYPEKTNENTNKIKEMIYGYYNLDDLEKRKGIKEYLDEHLLFVSDTSKVIDYDKYVALLSSLNGESSEL